MLRRFLVRKREAALHWYMDEVRCASILTNAAPAAPFLRRARRRLRLWDLALDIFTFNGRI